MNRRQLAGASGAALLVGLAGPGKAAELDGDLLARVDAFVAHLTEKRAVRAAMPERERLDAEAREIGGSVTRSPSQADLMAAEIARIPARTPEGARAKARAVVWQYGGDDTAQAGWALGTGLFESMLADLTGAACVLRPFPPQRPALERPAHPDAELLALCQEFHQHDHEAAALPGDEASEPAYRVAMDARWAASDKLQDMRPRTLDGRLAKAGVAARLMEENHGGVPVDAADVFVLATLRHVAGRTSSVTEGAG